MSHPMDRDAMYFCCGSWRYKSGGWHDCLGTKQGTKASDTKQVKTEIRAMEIAEYADGRSLPLKYAASLTEQELAGWICGYRQLCPPNGASNQTVAGWLAYQIASTPT